MSDCESTGESSTCLPSREMGVCVLSAAGLQPMFIMSMGGVEMLETGESITTTWNAFAGDVTLLDIERIEDED